MNANAFRHFYDYHFSENRIIWDRYVTPLTYAQFTQQSPYSHGSVRDQLLHLMNADQVWFCELQGIAPADPLPPADGDDRPRIRAYWDRIEQQMRHYLLNLEDDFLFNTPIEEPEEDQNLVVWQVLLHVVNHGTDHRAQLLRQLNDLGVQTSSQDYIFYVYDNPVK
ncbi:MAG: DinB family protein [Anaerolineales bacterium]|nr:DinB family protein [Anaerolineales bacterium]